MGLSNLIVRRSLPLQARVTQIDFLQLLEVQGGRDLVEGGGKHGSIFAVEGSDDRTRPIDRIGCIQQERLIWVACVPFMALIPCSAPPEKQPLIAVDLSHYQNKLRTL